MHTLLLGALALTGTADAQSYGGGGLYYAQTSIGWDIPGQRLPNAAACLGGTGYSVSDGKRKGGEGQFCVGPYTTMASGGVQLGYQGKRAGQWLTAHSGFGAGWVGVSAPDGGRFDGVFVYAKPAIGAGMALGPGLAIEGSAFLNIPVNVVSVLGGVDNKTTFPHLGGQVTLLFGDFRKKRAAPPEPPPQAEPPPARTDARGRPLPPPPREGPDAGRDRRGGPDDDARAPAPQAPSTGPMRPGDLPPAEGRRGSPPPPQRDDRDDREPPPPPEREAPTDSGDLPLAIPG